MPLNSPEERDRESHPSGNRIRIFAPSDVISGMLEIGKNMPANDHREEETGTLDRDAFTKSDKEPGG
jgi:hypothetical protein